ncbi:MAG: hypothetical protein ACTHJ7_00490 [Candidatus Nitrosocosmicus sp.]
MMRYNLIEQYTNILKTIIYLNSVSQSNGTIIESISSLYNQIIKKPMDMGEKDTDFTSSASSSTGAAEKELSNITADENNKQQQKILAVMNYLKFTGFIDYYIDNMKKDKITITISPVISAFLLQYYFEILNVLDNTLNSSTLLKDPKHKEDEKILLLQKLFLSSSIISPGAAGASQSTSIDF